MKYNLLILLVILSSCAAPISYVNSVPRTSGLEEQGDVIFNLNLGSDLRTRDKVIQMGAAWSPIQNVGLDIEYSGLMKLGNTEMSLERANFLNGSLIYYHMLGNQSNLEFKVSTGKGSVFGDLDENFFSILGSADLLIDTDYKTYSAQASYYFYIPNEETKLAIGLRARQIVFSNYTYEVLNNPSKSFEAENWNVYSLDPFIEANQNISGQLYFNTRISYSFVGEEVREEFAHPFFKKFGFTFGLQVRL